MKPWNHLKGQTSPYLLQHAQNPVDWYPWCEEAFEKARKEDKPVFLSIGYSTCHWCHVMAEESFEDPDTASLLNQKFVSVKVDREERPDLDAVYMAACQVMTGSGGWPMTMFLTPEKKPFFAGTYFPKHSSRGMMGFLELLSAVAEGWRTQRGEILNTAEGLLQHLRQQERKSGSGKLDAAWANQMLEKGMEQLGQQFDAEHGGFGMAPKFPMGHNLLFLMNLYERDRKEEVLQMAEKTLTQMQKGGIFDHLGGGFSRYSTDKYFLVPHFEKMLYDNALLIAAYSKGYELTRKKKYLDAAERTAGWMLREMQGKHGGFYSSQDADSQGEEGKFYTFTRTEILEFLGMEAGEDFAGHYGMTERGNFEGKNILTLLGQEEPGEAGTALREKVFQYRKQRYPLHTDDKVLAAWNGMAVWALADLYQKTRNRTWLKAAEQCMRFLLDQTGNGGDYSKLFASWRCGQTAGVGFLDDYAWVVCGLLGLYEASGDVDYLSKAQRFMGRGLRSFFDEKQAGFTLSGKETELILMNPKETYDGAMPSGNSVMAYNLVKLMHYSGRGEGGDVFEAAAEKQMTFMVGASETYPAGHCFFLSALLLWLDSSAFYVCRDGICAPAVGRRTDEEGV